MNKVKTRGWLGQPSIIKSLEQNFGDRAMKERLYLTPGSPRFTARRLENLKDKVSSEEHETYRSVVGTLLYLTKHRRPDICSPVKELSKTMDAPVPVHLKEMYKVIRYGLKFELRKDMKNLALKALSDSDFASDKETRISVFGYIIYFCGIAIAWRSKGMRTTSDRTKHIDIRTSFVKEYQEDGKIIIKFVKSEDNEVDIFTKNTTNVIFQNHQKKLVWHKGKVDNELNKELTQNESQQEGC